MRRALVFSGGGSRGSYEVGAWQALSELCIRFQMCFGTSIGAINAAIIAGNAPEDRVDRLQAFWDEICEPAEILALPAVAVREFERAFADYPHPV